MNFYPLPNELRSFEVWVIPSWIHEHVDKAKTILITKIKL